jgi:hypothetical protein
MKQSKLLNAMEVFPGSDIARRFTFKAMNTRDDYALLAVQNHQLAMIPVFSGGQSAHFRTIDCFECLSPYKNAA